MSKETFRLHILAADRPFYDGDCVSLVVPTPSGQYGVLAHHSDYIAAIVPGEITFTAPDSNEPVIAAVSEGIIKVEKGEVLVLVDTAESPDEIDENRARRAAEEAREQLLQKQSRQEHIAAQARLARAVSRLKAKHHGIHDN